MVEKESDQGGTAENSGKSPRGKAAGKKTSAKTASANKGAGAKAAGDPGPKGGRKKAGKAGRSGPGAAKSGDQASSKGSTDGAKEGKNEGPKVSPTGDMLTAHLLAMLNGWSAYGYELAQRLEESGLGQYNKGSIYRILRQMEDSGLVSSSWDTSKDGPARRIYDLTDMGSMFLKNWMIMAEMHRNFLRSMIEMNPLMSSLSPRKAAGQSTRDDMDAESDGE